MLQVFVSVCVYDGGTISVSVFFAYFIKVDTELVSKKVDNEFDNE